MLTESELSGMRQAILEVMPATALVKRATSASDGMGGQTLNWTTVIASVACQVEMPSGNAPGMSQIGRVVAERAGNRMVWVATFPYGTDIREGDQITVSGQVYEIIYTFNGSWDIARMAMVVRLD
jgi:hypothetical protein